MANLSRSDCSKKRSLRRNSTMEETSQRENELAISLEGRHTGLQVFESILWVFLVGSTVSGNALVCLSLYKTRGFRAPQNYYIACLAATDLLFAVLCMTLSLGSLIKGQWIFGDVFCQAQGSLIYIFAVVSLFTMALIAINRFFKITKSVAIYRRIYTKRNILLSILVAWIFAIALATAAFSFGTQPFRFHTGKNLCFLDMSHHKGIPLYTLGAYGVVCVVIFPSMLFCYFKAYWRVRAHFAEILNSRLARNASGSFADEARITRMLFVTLIAFLVCWTPAVCTDVYEALWGQYSLPRQLYFWQLVLLVSNSAVNPVIYGLMRREVRKAYKDILTCTA